MIVGGMALFLAATVCGADEHKPLIEISPRTNLADFKLNGVALSLAPEKDATVLSVKIKANRAFPGFSLAPAGGAWDLSSAKGVQAVVTNSSDALLSVSLRVENDADGKKHAWNVGAIAIGAGETRTVQAVFGREFGNPGFALDTKKIIGLTLYVGGEPANVDRTILVRSIETFTEELKSQPLADFGRPPGDGLVLWLDPSKESTVVLGADRRISKLRDRSDGHHDSRPASIDAAPELTGPEVKGRPMLHFAGKQALTVDAIRSAPGGVTVFVVYARLTGKQTPGPNPTLFCSRPDASKAIDADPNVLIAGPGPKSQWRFTDTVALENRPIGPITLGQDYAGNIGEVLVYDRVFISEGQRRRVLEYLQSKWNAGFPEPGWLRDGPPDPKPARTHDDLPLSDQANKGAWKLDPAFSDDFKSASLDLTRYHLAYSDRKDWLGRKPGVFRPENVTIKDGALNITCARGTPEQLKGHAGFEYATGYIRTQQRTGYGYYEIEARPAKTQFDSAFWLTDTGDPNNGLEIDIFEMGGGTKQYHNVDFMTAHVWGENGDKRHWGTLVAYNTSFDVGADFHVYGLEWNKDELVWYVDGSPCRRLKNTNWHLPQYLIFDLEPMLDWFGPVDEKTLPADYVVKYLRVWRQGASVTPAK